MAAAVRRTERAQDEADHPAAGAVEVEHVQLASRAEPVAHRGQRGALLRRRQVVQDEARHDAVERAGREVLRIVGEAFDEPHLDPRALDLLARDREHGRIAVEADHARLGLSRLDHERERARAAADVEHVVPGRDARLLDQPSLDRLLAQRERDERVVEARERMESQRGDIGAIQHVHTSVRRRRSAMAITETDDRLIAAAAIIGLSSRPKNG
jgi:hypothetical protein